MKKVITGAACAALLVTGALVAPAAAQSTIVRQFALADGPGATIGVRVAELTEEEAAKANSQGGVRIQEVQPNTPAEHAGFRSGDIVTQFDGERVRSARQFQRLVRETAPNRTVEAVIVRDGATQTLKVTPELGRAGSQLGYAPFEPLEEFFARPELRRGEPFAWGITPAPGRLGASVIDLDNQLAEYFGVSDGVLVTSVTAGSPAAAAGLKAGDVITSAGGRTVTSTSDIQAAVRDAKPGSTLELRVMRDKKEMVLKATLPGRERPQTSGAGRISL